MASKTATTFGAGLLVGGVVAVAFLKWKGGLSSKGSEDDYEEPPPVEFLEKVPSE